MRFYLLVVLLLFLNRSFTQEIKTGFDSISNLSTVFEYNSPDFNGVSYKIISDNDFKGIHNGPPFNNYCFIFPSEPAINSSFSIKISIIFNKEVDSLKLRLIDLDENGNLNADPEEFISNISPEPYKVKNVLNQNPVFLLGNMVTPDDNNISHDNNDASGWILWNKSIDTLSFEYNRRSTLYGIIIDSIYFQLKIKKCNQILDLGNDFELCEGENAFLQSLTSINGQFLWNTSETTSSISVNKSGWYKLTITDNQCIYKDSIHVNFKPIEINVKNVDYFKCNVETVLLTSPKLGDRYTWFDSTFLESKYVNDFGKYSLIIENYCKIDTVHFHVLDKKCKCDFEISDQTICVKDSVILGFENDNKTYNWSTNETFSKIKINKPGKYWLEINNDTCSYTDTFNVYVNNIEVVSHFESVIKCAEEKASLFSDIKGDSCLWYNGLKLRENFEVNPGRYYLKIYSYCRLDSIIFDVSDKLCDCYIYVPNSFTPNGDEFNNTFNVNLVCDYTNFYFSIYNRWGELIFESYNPNIGWDGSYDNKIVMEGVYIYKLEYYDLNRNLKHNLTGHVNVVL